MNRDPSDLLRRLHDFPFDEPHSARPFSLRLAQEQGWSAEFTARAIEEYRRFVVLTQTVDHPVCPSDEVDEVWHLHLLYTRNYWEDFCGQVLGRPLHHEPSRGGHDETHKHHHMYAATLDAYRHTFGEDPPADLWPNLAARFAPRAARRTSSKSPSQREPGRRRTARPWPWIVTAGIALPLVAGLERNLVVALQNPFDLSGAEFMLLYGLLFAVALAIAAYIRYRARHGAHNAENELPKLDPYEMAYLAGGMRRAVNTAIAELVRAGRLVADGKTPPRFTQSRKLAANAHPFERQVYKCFDEQKQGSTVQTVQRRGDTLCQDIRDKLRSHALLVSAESNEFATHACVLIFFALAGLGAVKVWIGISRDRPVAFLVIGCIVTVLVGLIGFRRRLHRTSLGDRALGTLQSQFSKLRDQFKRQPSLQDPVNSDAAAAPDLQYPLILGLYGLDLLASTPHRNLTQSLGTQNVYWGADTSTFSSSDSGSSDSGSSDGGGTGCGGGGGCSGGGCGGCGGSS